MARMRGEWNPTSVLITGASGGIGAALARALATPDRRLILTGRAETRLAAVAADCRVAGAEVDARAVDVTDADAMARLVVETDSSRPLDLVVANAGIATGTGGGGETEDLVRRVFAINVDGVLNTVLPVIPLMRARRHGQIAIMSSLAGFLGVPGSPAYCGTKAAVRLWGEGMRGWLTDDGIRVSVVCPGYVTTAMTARNTFPMPFLMSAERAAAIILKGLSRDRGRIAFPWPMVALVRCVEAIPPAWIEPIMRRLPRKP